MWLILELVFSFVYFLGKKCWQLSDDTMLLNTSWDLKFKCLITTVSIKQFSLLSPTIIFFNEYGPRDINRPTLLPPGSGKMNQAIF